MAKNHFSDGRTSLVGLCVLAILLFTCFGCLDIEIRERRTQRWVTAESGLRMREGPGLDFAPLGTIPFGAEVEVAGAGGRMQTLGGKRSRWYRVTYRGREGYAFGAYLSDFPLAGRNHQPRKNRPTPTNQEKVRPEPTARIAVPAREARKNAALPDLPYAVHNPPGLTRLSLTEFQAEKARFRERFRTRREEFRKSAGTKQETETMEAYLRRSEASKRAFLETLREREYAAATRIYSIYDAELELGGYHPAERRFDFLGTTIELGKSDKITTLPRAGPDSRGFENGRIRNVTLPRRTAQLLLKNQGAVRVRIDFSYTESLQDIFAWTSRAYFLPRFLMLYDRKTGEIYYECAVAQRVERGTDPAFPLKISGNLIYEKIP